MEQPRPELIVAAKAIEGFRLEVTRLRAVNAKMIQCLERIAGALDVPAASQLANVKELARMAIEGAKHDR